MKKRAFLIVLDSVGIGELPDAENWGDKGSNTLKAIRNHPNFNCPNLKNMGLFNIDTVGGGVQNPTASYARLAEKSLGKDTTIGHWEIAGVISPSPLPVYPNGFPSEVVQEFERLTGKKVLCNMPYSGTEVIKDYGKQQVESGDLIVYTSADSVFQIAAHEEVVPIEKLYEYCEIARKMLTGKHGVGRVIARPFNGEYPYTRTPRRHDYSLLPPAVTMLDLLKDAGKSVISVGKIYDIFAGRGLTEGTRIKNNSDGMSVTTNYAKQDFEGLCFTNLVDFDMVYGHRNDIAGYAQAMSTFDKELPLLIKNLKQDDILIITADHGCDPATPSTDHSREHVPMLIYGNNIKAGVNLNTRASFADISATILEYLGVDQGESKGESFLSLVLKN